MAFAKIKALLKKAAARTVHGLWDAIREAIDAISYQRHERPTHFGDSQIM
jgi:hypothetical protein